MDWFESDSPELFSEIDVFLKKDSIQDIDISLNRDDFDYVSLKLPKGSSFEVEDFLNTLEERNQNKYYIITTFIPYYDEPLLKKYYVPYARLNEFLFNIYDPEFDEQVISVSQAEEDSHA